MDTKQSNKVFVGGLSWTTDDAKLRAYFENWGQVLEAFVSYDKYTGRPRGFGFVVFESPEVADKVVAAKHTIDRREVEAKRAVPKDETQASQAAADASQKTRKIFVGGLAPTVDDQVLRQYFEQFGAVDDAVVMYDHDNKRPRGFGFITFAEDDSVDKVFSHGAMQNIHDKQIEIKPAVPRDQMPPQARRGAPFFPMGRGVGSLGPAGMPGFTSGRAPPFGFRQPLPAPGAFGPGPRTPGGMPYLQGGPSPRGHLSAGLAQGYGSPHARGTAAPYAPAAMQAPLQYGQQQQQQQQRFSTAGMGSSTQRFGAMGQQQFGGAVYGGLGFAGGDSLMQPGTSPGAVGMYGLGGPLPQLQPTQQQLQSAQQQGSLNGYPGQLDMAKLAPLTAGPSNPQGAAAAAAAAAMAAKGYSVQPGLAAGGFPGFAAGQQAFGGQAEPAAYAAGDPAAAAAAAAAAGYGAEAVAHMQGTSPLGTTPDFTTFAAGAAPWGS